MWLPGKQEVCAVLMLITMAKAVLIVGPNSLRANRDYTVVVSNFFGEVAKAELLLRLEGHDDEGLTLLNLKRTIDVKLNTNRIISFKIPPIERSGNFKITVEGINGTVYNQEIELEYKPNSIAGLIQLSQPVYKPGDNVQFRVIVLDSDLKPPSDPKMVTVTVEDPVGNNIRKWTEASLYNGVFEGQLDIAPSPLLGTYNIQVEANSEKLASKTFVVKEYVLLPFEVVVFPTVTPLEEHQALNLTIVASAYLDKPAIGTVKIDSYDEDENFQYSKEFYVNGTLQVHLPFTNELILFEKQQDVKLKVTFTELYSNQTDEQILYVTVYKQKYQVMLEKETPAFRPGSQFKCALMVKHRNGEPAKGVTVLVQILGLELSNPEQSHTSDDAGAIQLSLNTSVSTEAIEITASIDDQELLEEMIIKTERDVEKFIQIESRQRYVDLNSELQFRITCSDQMMFFVYYIVTKGNIVDSGIVRPGKMSRYILNLQATEKMMPRSNVVVATIINNIAVFDYVDIDFYEFQNKLDMRIKTWGLKPGSNIEITLEGYPDAYVALEAHDERIYQYDQRHDLVFEDTWKLFERLHHVQFNENHKIHNMGLFARTLEDVTIDTGHDKLARQEAGHEGQYINDLHANRKSFFESWLWKNVTLSSSGQSNLIAQAPDTITSWHLNGFVIDPMHGIGFINRPGPIKFHTLHWFFITDNLPYSIKRHEEVELHFTLFSLLDVEYIVNVTMLNENNEFEFVGLPAEAKNHTKSISVPPNVFIPISFTVKAKKLGDMTFRLKASTLLGLASDAIEKIIRVTPESLVIANRNLKLFSFSEPNNQTYDIFFDIDRRLDSKSASIIFSLATNNFTDVVHNNYTMQLRIQNTIKEYHFNTNSTGMLLVEKLPETTRKISVNIAGQGAGIIQVSYSYHLNLVYFERSFQLTVTRMDTDAEASLQLKVCTSFLPQLMRERSNMTLVEVILPSGYVTETGLINEEIGPNPITKKEILFGATTVVVYYDYMGKENSCFFITANKRNKEAIKRPSYVTVRDYYHPEINAIQIYQIDEQEVCGVCEPEDCPPSCSFYI